MNNSTQIIDIDEYKKNIQGYDPKMPHLVQTRSAKEANKYFDKLLKEGKYSEVILMAGGSASGKTEFVHSHLYKEDAIIFDSTLSKFHGAEVKIRNCQKHKIGIHIIFIVPDKLERAYLAFINRERKLADSIFVETHMGSRKTIKTISEKNYNVKIDIIESSYNLKDNKLHYKELKFASESVKLRYIQSIQLSNQELCTIIRNSYEGN